MYAFDYRRPATLNEADLAIKAMPTAKLLAGGQTLLPTMKQRLAKPDALIDLGAIKDLKAISVSASALTIGAMATHEAVSTSKDVIGALPGLAELAGGIGDPQVRNRGTIGGSLANNDPAADYPAAILALGATINTNKRAIPADSFFQGLFTTALADGEIITSISIPLPQKFAYAKFPNPASRYALVGSAVAQRGTDVRVTVTGASTVGVARVDILEEPLKTKFAAASLDSIRIDPTEAVASDIHADAAYRAHLMVVMAKRAVAKLA